MLNLCRYDSEDDRLYLFPKALPDETLRSFLSRFALLNGMLLENKLGRLLFRRANVDKHLYGTDVWTLSKSLSDIDRDEFYFDMINNNTFLSFIANFSGINKKDYIAKNNRPLDSKYLQNRKLCQACIAENARDYGVFYWHRSHQVPGVVCCWKHKLYLTDFATSDWRLSGSKDVLNTALDELDRGEILLQEVSDFDIAYAVFVKDVLNLREIGLQKIDSVLNFLHNESVQELITTHGYARKDVSAYCGIRYSYFGSFEDTHVRLLWAYKVFGTSHSMSKYFEVG